MDFRPANFKLLLVAGVMLAAGPGLAQSGQSIIFSQPPDDSADSGAASPPHTAQDNNLANQVHAPSSIFSAPPEPDQTFTPLPRSPLSAEEQRQLQKKLEDRKNWTLLTPEEILGVKKPENYLTPDQQPDAQDQNLTPMERYLKRQEQARLPVPATNGLFGGNDALSRWNSFRKPEELPDGSRVDPNRAAAMSASPYLRQLFNDAPENNPPAGRNGVGTMSRMFGFGPTPTPSPAQVQAQIAEMSRFRELLAPESAAAKTSPGGKFLFSSQPLPEAGLQSASQAKVGFNELTPLGTVNNKVSAVTPLTGLSDQPLSKPATAARPSWAPQPPPWLSQTPQPFTPPQREF